MMAPDSSINSVTLVCRRRNVREGVALWVWKVKAGGEERGGQVGSIYAPQTIGALLRGGFT